ncbi:MAG: RagB/SusD family nutrient uptake outer membrane protein [Bacteroidota bacterium]|nr:RagB/SusD family nutrient uptake outer membrane protein [Flavisolibacter sp.]MBD0365878.1 RagB/SusD family nutrient uptake outer membrane protein [Flavisolibacter sp.]MDQ3847188.1 RagB/SusD family nutrient uptake outer membrane protein [Bacteroidota bacterium]
MKSFSKYILTACIAVALVALNACKKSFLEPQPYGRYTAEQLQSKKGLEALLVGTYGMLDGQGISGASSWMVGATNWVYGDVSSDDAYKGTDANDQPQMTEIELYNSQPANTYFYYKWLSLYEGVARANDVIRFADKIAELTEADKKDYIAQARFLRGHFHFEAKRLWNKVPYIDEKTTTYDNKADIWPQIEADFKAAYDNLPETQPLVGKANKWAAGAYLAKAYMYDKKFAEAKALYDVIIPQGKTSNGKKYALQDQYWKNFDVAFENSEEAVFSMQTSASGTVTASAEVSYELAYPYGGVWGCCGFYQPSHNLVNAFKTDGAGLPFLDESYNNTNLKNDEGILANDPFTPDATTPLDPRLDWTVGRRGIPYWDYGPHPGRSWIRDQPYAGPYSPKKHVNKDSDRGGLTNINNFRQTAKNYNIIRFADVLLMAAEAEIEAPSGSLAKAQEYINLVRKRAANPAGFVQGAPANYQIKEYTQPFANKETARKIVRFERRLELGMEGHRFFDLVRWGIAAEVLNAYLTMEKNRRSYLKSSVGGFTKGKNEYYPIPNRVIEVARLAGNTLEQNSGY